MKLNNRYYDNKSELEIIKKYQELILYAYNLFQKYLNDKSNFLEQTGNCMHQILKYLVLAKEVKTKRLEYLELSFSELRLLEIFVRLAKKSKYISSKNYQVWSYKINDIQDMLEKWIYTCQK